MGAEFSVLNKLAQRKDESLSISSLIAFFSDEKKSIKRGENHYKSDHIKSFNYQQGALRVEVHASMKKMSTKSR